MTNSYIHSPVLPFQTYTTLPPEQFQRLPLHYEEEVVEDSGEVVEDSGEVLMLIRLILDAPS